MLAVVAEERIKEALLVLVVLVVVVMEVTIHRQTVLLGQPTPEVEPEAVAQVKPHQVVQA